MPTVFKKFPFFFGKEISRRHASWANIAFLDGHVEHGSFWDWTLPVPAAWNRWDHRNRWLVKEFQHFDANNWATLYSGDELMWISAD